MNNSAIFEERNKIRVCAGSVRADSYGMPFALKAAGERLSGANRIPVARKSDIILKDIVSCKAFIAFVDFLEFLEGFDSFVRLPETSTPVTNSNTFLPLTLLTSAVSPQAMQPALQVMPRLKSSAVFSS